MIPKVNNTEMKNEIVLYQSNELQERIEVSIEDETVCTLIIALKRMSYN
ncbi:MAG TPA: hypothetical protein VIK55_20015 [Paludibacter sp.]